MVQGMDTDLERRVAAELRAELARQGRSRHWLADETGIPVTTVARWLRGKQSPRLNDLDAMTRALNLTVFELLEATERQRTAMLRSSADLAAASVGAPAPVAQRIEHLTTDQKPDHFLRPRRDRRRRRDWQRIAAPVRLSVVRCEDEDAA